MPLREADFFDVDLPFGAPVFEARSTLAGLRVVLANVVTRRRSPLLYEYSLDFEVWFYADVDHGLRTKSDLYQAIYERFEQEGSQDDD